MTEIAYRPNQTPEAFQPQERLVFVDPADLHGREFEINTPQRQPIGADSPEINQAVEDAHAAIREERDRAAAGTPEHVTTDIELARAIDWNAQTIRLTRDHEVATQGTQG